MRMEQQREEQIVPRYRRDQPASGNLFRGGAGVSPAQHTLEDKSTAPSGRGDRLPQRHGSTAVPEVRTVMDTAKLKRIANQVRALREITEVSGTVTKRAQGSLLQSLSSEELTFVAEELMEGKNKED